MKKLLKKEEIEKKEELLDESISENDPILRSVKKNTRKPPSSSRKSIPIQIENSEKNKKLLETIKKSTVKCDRLSPDESPIPLSPKMKSFNTTEESVSLLREKLEFSKSVDQKDTSYSESKIKPDV